MRPLTQEEFDAKVPGDTVYVGPKSYYETFPFAPNLYASSADKLRKWLMYHIEDSLAYDKYFIVYNIRYIINNNNMPQGYVHEFFCTPPISMPKNFTGNASGMIRRR